MIREEKYHSPHFFFQKKKPRWVEVKSLVQFHILKWIWTLSMLTHYPASFKLCVTWNENVTPNSNTRWTASRMGWENEVPSQNRQAYTQSTHPIEPVLLSFPKIGTENTELLMSPYLSLGVLPSSQPLELNYNPNLYCQWLQSSITQKCLLQKPHRLSTPSCASND